MRVFRDIYDDCLCDNCDKKKEVFNVRMKDGTIMLRLCKECLMNLLKAIVERD